jgi:hypothetical protein
MSEQKVEEAKVAEVAKPRTKEAIEAEYRNVCLEAGDIQYRMEVFKSSLKQFNEKLFQLNQEAHAVQEAEKKKDSPSPIAKVEEPVQQGAVN